MSEGDLLRKAVVLMRERAETATPGPWWTDGFTVRGGPEGRSVAPAHNADRKTATHIASWHPVVAVAVADWLEETARLRDALGPNAADWPAAEAVARVYLGES